MLRPAVALALLGATLAALAWVQKPSHGLRLERLSSNSAPSLTGFPPWAPSSSETRIDRHVRFDVVSLAENDPRYLLTPDLELRWSGWLYFPRAGNYRLEIESDDGSTLWLGSAKVIDNSGRHPRRIRGTDLYLERGWLPVRIDYSNGAGGGYFDLRWRLPSGYNALTRVPRVYMRPDRPHPLPALQRAMQVGAVLAFGLALVAWCWPALRRFRSAVAGSHEVRAALAVGILVTLTAGVLRVGTVGAQGETCDEWAYVGAGDIAFRNLVALEFDSEQWRTNREHPPVGKLILGAAVAAFGHSPTSARVATGLLGAATACLIFLIGRRLGGLFVGGVAGLLTALLPPLLAHGNIGTLESPLAFFYTAAVGAFLRGLEGDARATRWLGLAWLLAGLAVATKFTAGFLVPFFYLCWIAWHARAARESGTVPMPWGMYFGPVLAVLPLFLLWPWLWERTLEHMLDTLGHWRGAPGPELFLGEVVVDRPRSYFAVWFAAATPVAVLAAAALGLARAFKAGDRRWLVVAAWLGLPFLWSFVSLRQGGYRYVYPAFYPLALLAALGADALARLVPGLRGTTLEASGGPRPRWAHALAAAAVLLPTSLGAARTAPYWHYYFNEALGGTAGAYSGRRFDIGFWGEGFDRAVAWLNVNAPVGATVGPGGAVDHTLFGLRPDLRRCLEAGAHCDPNRDFIVLDTIRSDRLETPGYELAFAVEVDEAPICAVLRRTSEQEPAAQSAATPSPPKVGPPARPKMRLFTHRRPLDLSSDRGRTGTRRRPPETAPRPP